VLPGCHVKEEEPIQLQNDEGQRETREQKAGYEISIAIEKGNWLKKGTKII